MRNQSLYLLNAFINQIPELAFLFGPKCFYLKGRSPHFVCKMLDAYTLFSFVPFNSAYHKLIKEKKKETHFH